MKISDQAVVEVPDWPQNWTQEIEERTNTTLKKSKEFKLITD